MKRVLPEWLKANSLDNKTANGENTENLSQRRTLRSNYSFDGADKQNILKPIDYPPIVYNGKINYFTEMIDIAFSCDSLIKWIEQQPSERVPVAFDMEWPFSFKTGPGKSAVIQICADPNECFVFQLTKLKKLPVALLELLTHKKIKLHGVNIKCDFRKLERDFPEAKSQQMIDQSIDLAVWCNSVLNTSGRWSLERLVAEICKLKISKDKAVRMSEWHIVPLTDKQKLYAAIDVYISQVIYYELERLERKRANEEAEFVNQYGEEALNVYNSLQYSSPNEEQFNILITFIENHGENKSLWEYLTAKLNNVGPPEYTFDGWINIWDDVKQSVEDKLKDNEECVAGPGGDPSLIKKLSPVEERIAKLPCVSRAVDTPLECNIPSTSKNLLNQSIDEIEPQLLPMNQSSPASISSNTNCTSPTNCEQIDFQPLLNLLNNQIQQQETHNKNFQTFVETLKQYQLDVLNILKDIRDTNTTRLKFEQEKWIAKQNILLEQNKMKAEELVFKRIKLDLQQLRNPNS